MSKIYLFSIIGTVFAPHISGGAVPNAPDSPEFEFAPTVPSEPYWLNEARRCCYYSEIGVSLGYIQLGTGSARSTWFSYVGDDTEPITPGGRADREAAKSDVVRMVEIEVGLRAAEQEHRDEQRRKR